MSAKTIENQSFDQERALYGSRKLTDCEMEDADLSFEKSEVEAAVTTPIVSVKNPRWGTVSAPAVGEVIMDDPQARGRVILTAPAEA